MIVICSSLPCTAPSSFQTGWLRIPIAPQRNSSLACCRPLPFDVCLVTQHWEPALCRTWRRLGGKGQDTQSSWHGVQPARTISTHRLAKSSFCSEAWPGPSEALFKLTSANNENLFLLCDCSTPHLEKPPSSPPRLLPATYSAKITCSLSISRCRRCYSDRANSQDSQKAGCRSSLVFGGGRLRCGADMRAGQSMVRTKVRSLQFLGTPDNEMHHKTVTFAWFYEVSAKFVVILLLML